MSPQIALYTSLDPSFHQADTKYRDKSLLYFFGPGFFHDQRLLLTRSRGEPLPTISKEVATQSYKTLKQIEKLHIIVNLEKSQMQGKTIPPTKHLN